MELKYDKCVVSFLANLVCPDIQISREKKMRAQDQLSQLKLFFRTRFSILMVTV